ncbi:EthD domain-containing protein [Novosphingobium lentum]|uniref:EthD domain-containing protein n=1 Tax=Novosphingobium lentum TaxID=145287 RepID=UPI00082D866B|nr:EthD domain-containing protein [Novosphingobium lentum]
MIRLVHLLKRRADVSAADFDRQWRDVMGPAFAAEQTHCAIVRHVQTWRGDTTAAIEAAAQADRGAMESAADGVAETWWSSEDALRSVLASADARQRLARLAEALADLTEPGGSPLWLAHEYPQVLTGPQRVVAGARTGVVKVHFALRPLPQLTDADARGWWLTRHGPLVRSHAAARGALAYTQVHRTPSPLTAELAAIFGAPEGDYMGHAEAWFDRLSPRTGPEADAAKAAAVADERRFIDWTRSTFLAGKERVFVDRDW